MMSFQRKSPVCHITGRPWNASLQKLYVQKPLKVDQHFAIYWGSVENLLLKSAVFPLKVVSREVEIKCLFQSLISRNLI